MFEKAADLIIELADRYYNQEDESVLPKSILTKKVFENAMSLDIAMGGSTNTVLHILAVANEAGVDFTVEDIDRLSRRVPCISKVAPNSSYHIQDVNRAGGIIGILGELDRAGLIDTSVKRVDYGSLKDALDDYDIMRSSHTKEAEDLYRSAPGNIGRNLVMGSQSASYDELDTDRSGGCIRSAENCYYPDGGLAVLFGNIAEKGCIVKTAGVDPSIFKFEGYREGF